MHKSRHFISREKQVFLVGFSLTFPRFPRISKNQLNTSLEMHLRQPRVMYSACGSFTKHKEIIKNR